jgi:hypothetical protein
MATEFACHCKTGACRWHGRYIFFLLILCFTSTQLSDGFFLISYWRKAQVDLSKHIPLRSHIYHIVTGVKQTVLEAMAI